MRKPAIFLIAVLIIVLSGCRELSRKNPYDPSSADYKGITYKGEELYPADFQIKKMASAGGYIAFAGTKEIYGDCAVKTAAGASIGVFTGISDICADDSGNFYAVDRSTGVTVIDAMNMTSVLPFSTSSGIDSLYIEWMDGNLYITNEYDNEIYRIPDSGGAQMTVSVSVTAQGYFTPGEIFKFGASLYVVNTLNKKQAIKYDQNLSSAEVINFGANIIDACVYGGALQVLSESAVYKTDGALAVLLKWGDFGEGPGRVFNGKSIAYNTADGLLYIQDGSTIKKFGE
jgi:hypothetical protein